MKFGKEFARQMVPEWQDAYMDYHQLKKLLKDILVIRQKHAPHSQAAPAVAAASPQGSLQRRVSLHRAFSGLKSKHRGLSLEKRDDEVILVNATNDEDGHYQTLFLMSSEESGEYEVLFFKRLDDEFNKVVSFYRKKVKEAVGEADELSRQMIALIALRIKVEKPVVELDEGSVHLATGDDAKSFPASRSNTLRRRNPGSMRMEVIQEDEMSMEGEEEGDNEVRTSKEKCRMEKFRPAPLEILDHVKINIEAETPISTIKCVLNMNTNSDSFSTAELKKAEGKIASAFTEFYHKLRVLKSYSFLNQLAFSKIMKKYDKVSGRRASMTYLNMVDDSYLGSSEEITRLMERVEAVYIKHFANGNHRKGMRVLRPVARRDKHRVTFLLGCFFGCSLALTAAIVVAIQAANLLEKEGRTQYMDNIFPLYCLFGFIVLHMIMYGANVYFWKRYHINYPFIFNFKQGTELGYREVYLLSFGLAVLTLAAVLSHLDMEMDPKTNTFVVLIELVPSHLLLIVVLILLCPFNIIFRSSRFFFVISVFHCLCAPFYKVTLPDFFLADQMASQVQGFRYLQFYVCYYGWGDFAKRSHKCAESKIFEAFTFVIAILPYWLRVLQCLRRLIEEKNIHELYNGLKYFSTIIAVVMRLLFELRKGVYWQIMAAVTSTITTIFNTYWDVVMDWGLLRLNSKNPWLRDKLAVPNHKIYFLAMVVNVLLRLAWMQSVLGIRDTPSLHRAALTAIVACLEIIRRGIWNFFRIENEHLNNVGKYRAFKSVPLPFHHVGEVA